MEKNYNYHRKRQLIGTIVMSVTLLPIMVWFFIRMRHNADSVTSLNNTALIILFAASAIGIVAFFYSVHHDNMGYRCLKREKAAMKEKEFNNICELIKSGKKEESVKELYNWRRKFDV